MTEYLKLREDVCGEDRWQERHQKVKSIKSKL